MEIKLFNDFNTNTINENFTIPKIDISEFLNNVEYTSEKHILAIAAKYNTYKQYIDVLNKKTHQFKLNDITGDILNNNRVVMMVYCFHDYEIDKIRENLIKYCMSTFYNQLPQQMEIFGSIISPISLINKDELKKVFEERYTKELTIKIISALTKTAYDGKQNEFYLWKVGI